MRAVFCDNHGSWRSWRRPQSHFAPPNRGNSPDTFLPGHPGYCICHRDRRKHDNGCRHRKFPRGIHPSTPQFYVLNGNRCRLAHRVCRWPWPCREHLRRRRAPPGHGSVRRFGPGEQNGVETRVTLAAEYRANHDNRRRWRHRHARLCVPAHEHSRHNFRLELHGNARNSRRRQCDYRPNVCP